MKVLVTGGAGYIGSVVTEKLLAAGHEAFVYDNLSKGHRSAVPRDAHFFKGDLRDREILRAFLIERKIEAVIHLAADSLVGESVTQPAKYFHNNLYGGMVLLNAMLESNVKRLVFSSTAAVYGEPEKQPIEESDPTAPTNPYGESKLAFERLLHWYEQAYGIRYASLRYFNACGATERNGEHHNPETHLIPLVLQTANKQRNQVEIFGDDYPTRDGTCVRDYIHVSDLAQAHILALTILDERSSIYNLGCGGEGYTVREVIEAARTITEQPIEAITAPRRAGDPAVLVASSEKIKRELGWQPAQQDLHEIIASAWKWMKQHPHGYEV